MCVLCIVVFDWCVFACVALCMCPWLRFVILVCIYTYNCKTKKNHLLCFVILIWVFVLCFGVRVCVVFMYVLYCVLCVVFGVVFYDLCVVLCFVVCIVYVCVCQCLCLCFCLLCVGLCCMQIVSLCVVACDCVIMIW